MGRAALVGPGIEPHNLHGASRGIRGPCGTGPPGPQRPPASGRHRVVGQQGLGAKNGPACPIAAWVGREPPAGHGVVDGRIPPANGACRCVRRAVRPLLARLAVMVFQMRCLEAHCLELLTRRLALPGAGRQDMCQADYFPPAGPGLQPLRPYPRLPCWRVHWDRQKAGDGGEGMAVAPLRVDVCAKHGRHPVRHVHSGVQSTAAGGPMRATRWMPPRHTRRRKRPGHGCSPPSS